MRFNRDLQIDVDAAAEEFENWMISRGWDEAKRDAFRMFVRRTGQALRIFAPDLQEREQVAAAFEQEGLTATSFSG